MGYEFHFQIAGDRHLPIVLFLHGFLGSSDDFNSVVASLSQQFCCLTIDLPGHGQTIVTGTGEDYTMAATAQALVAWLDRLAVSQCYLVGYSMGGRLALYLAIHFPDRFTKIVLESASSGLKTDRERQARRAHDWTLANQLEADFAAFLAGWYQQPLFQSLRQQPNFEQILAQRSHNRPIELANSLRYLSTGNQPSLWYHLPQLQQPLLLVVGGNDNKFLALNQAIAEQCPTAQLRVVANCGHVVHLEQPEQFTQLVQAFFTLRGSQHDD